MASYKQLCARCKKNYVLASWRNKYLTCYDCQKTELSKEIENKKMKKFFDLPEDFYKKNAFLRNIKLSYLRFGELSEKQTEAFKTTVAKIKDEE